MLNPQFLLLIPYFLTTPITTGTLCLSVGSEGCFHKFHVKKSFFNPSHSNTIPHTIPNPLKSLFIGDC
jgi:hypothetical protein